MTIAECAERVGKLDLHREVQIALGVNALEVIRLNQAQLYDKGQDITGARLKGYEQPWYIAYKLGKNPAGVTDLKDTGALYDAMYLDVEPETFEVGSQDEKEMDLQGKYGKDIFGLSADSIGQLIEQKIMPALVAAIEKQTGLAMT